MKFQPQFYWLSMLLGVVGAALLIFTSARRWMRDNAQSMETEPFALFVGKNVVFAILILGFSYLLASNKGLPNVLIIMGALILLYTFITTRMTVGRRIYAMGGNRLAAQLSGIRTDRLTLLTFVNMGVLAGLGGADCRCPPQLGDAKRGQFLRARRHRSLFHRRRLRFGRRRQR